MCRQVAEALARLAAVRAAEREREAAEEAKAKQRARTAGALQKRQPGKPKKGALLWRQACAGHGRLSCTLVDTGR